jgi:hypothetical protein
MCRASKGLHGGLVSHGVGRPRMLNDRWLRRLRQLVREGRQPGQAKSVGGMVRALGFPASKATIHRSLRRMSDIKLVRPRRVAFLTARQKRARLEHAKSMERVSIEAYWQTVTFADEKHFSINGQRTAPSVWAISGVVPKRTVMNSDRAGCKVWGAIGPNGLVGPIQIHRTLTGVVYKQILDNIESQLSPVYYDDGARPHITADVAQWFIDNGIERCQESLQRPAKMPEGNLMEDVWAVISHRVYAGNTVHMTVAGLWQSIQEAFQAMKTSGDDVRVYQRAIRSLPGRYKKIRKARGGVIGF